MHVNEFFKFAKTFLIAFRKRLINMCMTNLWNRWNNDPSYKSYEQIEVLYIDNQNQICLHVEKTEQIQWNRTENIILGWRPVSQPKTEEQEITIVRYWNYIKGKFWPNFTTPPNPRLPNYLRVTMTLKNGKIETKYEPYSR
jgi:hypothetical protein